MGPLPHRLLELRGCGAGVGSGVSHPVTTGLLLLDDNMRTMVTSGRCAPARAHTPYLAHRSCCPHCGLPHRCAICGGWRHLPEETRSTGLQMPPALCTLIRKPGPGLRGVAGTGHGSASLMTRQQAATEQLSPEQLEGEAVHSGLPPQVLRAQVLTASAP